MKPKTAGCCSKCDAEVFEVKTRDPETRRPKQLGRSLDNAMRLTFLLIGGSRMDLTFCDACADTLTPADYPALWGRVMASWLEESPDHPWPASQRDNAILALTSSRAWKEVA